MLYATMRIGNNCEYFLFQSVVDYQVRGVGVSEEDSQFTKDDILSIMKEHPENKLW